MWLFYVYYNPVITNLINPIIAAIVGLIIGYFLGKSSKKADRVDISALKHKNIMLQASLDDCRHKQSGGGPIAARQHRVSPILSRQMKTSLWNQKAMRET